MIPVSRPSIGQDELDAVAEVFKSGWLGFGEITSEFEEAIKRRLGCRNAIAVNTGTSALHLALVGSGIGPGDEVIVPTLTFVASIQAILAVGATPVFCESSEDTLLMDPEDVSYRVTSHTRAIMPVHYGGQACDMERLLALADKYGFTVIEDAAHAFGSTYKGRSIGSFGHATCFSFDPIKQITCGEGGMVTLDDDRLAERIRRLRLLGIDRDAWQRTQQSQGWAYEVTDLGYRYHMPNFCAAIGLAQLAKLDRFIQRRREICRAYDAAFKSLERVRPLFVEYEQTAPFLYILKVPTDWRDTFMDFLKQREIGTGVHYIANHIQPFFKRYATTPLIRAERLWREIVSLPLYPDMTDYQVRAVIDAVVAFQEETTRRNPRLSNVTSG